jgi:hypothetical protein
VLWHGSLNLLANFGPTDLMMRVTDASACEQVRRIMTKARRDRPLAPRHRGGAGRRTGSRSQFGPGDVLDGRLYLDVSYEEKEEAKRTTRARWDQEHRLWYVDATTPRTVVARWLPPEPQP